MRIDRLERSKHVTGRILLYLEDGSVLKVTEQELLDFSIRAGDELAEDVLARLRAAAGGSNAKAAAAGLIGRRAMSRRDLEEKLAEKGVTQTEARYAAEWLEAIGALNDADYAAMLVRHCADRGYGPARYRQELHKHGIDRELWEEALAAAPEPAEVIERFLQSKLRGGAPDERERKRLSDGLLRRGFSWSDARAGLSAWTEVPSED